MYRVLLRFACQQGRDTSVPTDFLLNTVYIPISLFSTFIPSTKSHKSYFWRVTLTYIDTVCKITM